MAHTLPYFSSVRITPLDCHTAFSYVTPPSLARGFPFRACVLGAFEVGDNCSIAANAVLLKPLEDNVTAVGIPARPVKKRWCYTSKTERDHDSGRI